MTFRMVAWVTSSMILKDIINQWLIHGFLFLILLLLLVMTSTYTPGIIVTRGHIPTSIIIWSLLKIIRIIIITFLSKV